MEYADIVSKLAPCGLNCSKCAAYKDGDIATDARNLAKNLENFGNFAEKFSKFMPVFQKYNDFLELLGHFASASCPGCRIDPSKCYPGCIPKDCTKEQGVDFCGQCKNFPCDKVTFDEGLQKRWLKMNTVIKEEGVEEFYSKTKDLPRYTKE